MADEEDLTPEQTEKLLQFQVIPLIKSVRSYGINSHSYYAILKDRATVYVVHHSSWNGNLHPY